ncbi:hypothetical protein CJ030_MR5G023754 [Morella rubra]|uniref:Uncharacterized protein n=1 Tax=Morella rubra TaxID=262757 RepID=A0A6A1VJ85_9ROSI|nr:hypothetical protein CJ030_MR5G023754 [Morella rubra]
MHLQFLKFQLLNTTNLGKDCLSYRDHLVAWVEKARQELKVWRVPCCGFVMINMDAAVRQSYVAIGCIGHDYHGMSPLLAEWMALQMAAGEAALRRLEQVCLRVILFLLFLTFLIPP